MGLCGTVEGKLPGSVEMGSTSVCLCLSESHLEAPPLPNCKENGYWKAGWGGSGVVTDV